VFERWVELAAVAWTAAALAAKKAGITTAVFMSPALVLAATTPVSLPSLFSQIGAFLGPHVVSGLGAVAGTAIRFQIFKMPWHRWPGEAFAACGLGLFFGQVPLPYLNTYLEKTSPEMFPLANGAAIGVCITIGVGMVTDFVTQFKTKFSEKLAERVAAKVLEGKQ
jgi:hypothetical protein